jgi:hypothetical protein
VNASAPFYARLRVRNCGVTVVIPWWGWPFAICVGLWRMTFRGASR